MRSEEAFRFEVVRFACGASRSQPMPYLHFRDRSAASTFLRRWFAGGPPLRGLRSEMAACGERAVHGMSDDELRARAAALLVRGTLRIARMPATPRIGDWDFQPSSTAEDSALGPLPEADLGWIEFEVFDELGKPLASEPYELVLPDGSNRTGTLDGKGFARVEPMEHGVCELRFPRRDKLDWDPSLERYDRTGPTWVEIELLDADGKPCAEEPFVIHCADGRKIGGQLDESGQARVEDLVADECGVEFTRRDWRDLEIPGR